MRGALAGVFADAAPDSWVRRLLERTYGNGFSSHRFNSAVVGCCKVFRTVPPGRTQLIHSRQRAPVLGCLGQMALSFSKSEQLTSDANSPFNGSRSDFERDNALVPNDREALIVRTHFRDRAPCGGERQRFNDAGCRFRRSDQQWINRGMLVEPISSARTCAPSPSTSRLSNAKCSSRIERQAEAKSEP